MVNRFLLFSALAYKIMLILSRYNMSVICVVSCTNRPMLLLENKCFIVIRLSTIVIGLDFESAYLSNYILIISVTVTNVMG